MGFDDGECYICYSIGRGNESTDSEYDICFGCLDKLADGNGRSVTGRWFNNFAQRIQEGNYGSESCDFCGQEKCFIVRLSICDRHIDDED